MLYYPTSVGDVSKRRWRGYESSPTEVGANQIKK